MMEQNKIWYGLLFLICFSLPAAAQQFNFTAALDTVPKSGFYTIVLSPLVSAYIKTDFADIRIADKNKRWVPHILRLDNTAFRPDMFSHFPILENTITDSGKNLLVIENIKPEGIYNLQLFVKNIAVNRTATLSGSNNRKNWYIIDDKISISRSYETATDEYVQQIHFPLSTYHFLKLTIDNLHNDPLYITKAGFYAQPVESQLKNFYQNPLPTFTQKDDTRYSVIEVKQNNNYHFDRIFLKISGSKFYSRDVQIHLPASAKKHLLQPGAILGSFKLMSSRPAIIEIDRIKAAVFFIVINNGE